VGFHDNAPAKPFMKQAAETDYLNAAKIHPSKNA
jgi:hypothetical protein